MESIRQLVLLIMLCTANQGLFAHALWIETNEKGDERKNHGVTIFYAEPNDKRELITDWWSDTASFTLWLITPDGERNQLNLQKEDDHFTSSFMPKTPGLYNLSIHHDVAQLAGETQYQFNASATVSVGNTKTVGKNASHYGLFLQQVGDTSQNEKKAVSILLLDGEKPVSQNMITVTAPNGWQKTVKTDENGMAIVDSEWSGQYIFEGFKTEEVSNEEFTKKVRVITLLADIK